LLAVLLSASSRRLLKPLPAVSLPVPLSLVVLKVMLLPVLVRNLSLAIGSSGESI
jgi:hypothetical protein